MTWEHLARLASAIAAFAVGAWTGTSVFIHALLLFNALDVVWWWRSCAATCPRARS